MSKDDWSEVFKPPDTPQRNEPGEVPERVRVYAYDDEFDDPPPPASQSARNLGLVGSALLILGTFVPILSLPIVGTMNYFSNGQGDGVFVIGIAAVSFLLIGLKRFRWLWLTGIASLALIGYAFFNFVLGMRQMGSEVAQDDAFGLGSLMMQSVQLQWGWLVLVAGSVLTLLAARQSHE